MHNVHELNSGPINEPYSNHIINYGLFVGLFRWVSFEVFTYNHYIGTKPLSVLK